jgi:hypothetical protein
MEKEFRISDKEQDKLKENSELMVRALIKVPPYRLRVLADFFEKYDSELNLGGTEVQDDLREMADLSEKALETILNKITN